MSENKVAAFRMKSYWKSMREPGESYRAFLRRVAGGKTGTYIFRGKEPNEKRIDVVAEAKKVMATKRMEAV